MCLRVPCFQRRGQCLQSRAISVLERAERFIQFRRALCYQIFEMILVMSLGYDQFMMMERTFNRGFSLTEIEGLHQIIECTKPKRVDRTLDRLHAADHDDDRIWRSDFDMRNHFQTGHAAHGDVANDQVEFRRTKLPQRLFGRSGFATFVSAGQEVAEHSANFWFVVNNQETRLCA